jgi:hypothetical protein
VLGIPDEGRCCRYDRGGASAQTAVRRAAAWHMMFGGFPSQHAKHLAERLDER